ncbi:MAG TPA: N-acetylglutamate synthase [Planctomycetaceae bacterium]|nr:N-acetylglutamate synthase [Planctomycetaceae bacterium]
MEQGRLTTDYTIRRAVEADLESVRALLEPLVVARKVLRRTRIETLALLEAAFVAECGQSIAGFCAVEIYSKKLAEIQCLVVDSEHQRQGLGGKLVQACVDLARQRGVMEVMAISASEKFLQDLGFDYSLPDQKRALFFQLRSRDEVYREMEGEE